MARITNEFIYKMLIIDIEDNKSTQDEIKKLGLNNAKLRASFTANKNLLLSTKEELDFREIVANTDLLPLKKRINLNEIKNNDSDIVIKGLDEEKAHDYEEEIMLAGIIEFRTFNSAKSKILFGKCKSLEVANKLIADGLNLEYVHYKVDKYIKPLHVLQCLRCNQFNHKANDCTNTTKCKHCGDNHESKDCTSNNIKCSNCGGNHKATYKKCQEYIKQAKEKEKKLAEKNDKPRDANNRTFSSTVSSSTEIQNKATTGIFDILKRMQASQANYEARKENKLDELLTSDKANAEKIAEIENKLNHELISAKVHLTSNIDSSIAKMQDKIESLETEIDAKLNTANQNIKNIQNDFVNQWIGVHNVVNPKNVITAEQFKNLAKSTVYTRSKVVNKSTDNSNANNV